VEIKLYRNHLLVISMAIVGLFYTINRLNIIYNSDFTSGVVIGVKEWAKPHSKEIYQTAPVISFEYHKKKHIFTGEINTTHEIGEKLTIIIKNGNPKNARVYDFTGFWLNAALYCIIPILLLSAVILSFIGSERYILLSFGKKRNKSINDKNGNDSESSFLKQLR
jgi:hypothetical protein